MSSHDCEAENCVEKVEHKHLHLICKSCEKKCYLEHFQRRSDVLSILLAFDIIITSSRNDMAWSTQKNHLNKLNDAISGDSMFMFKCLQCCQQEKSDNSENEELMNTLNSQIESLNYDLSEKNNEIV